jgi:hypothetical protein
MCDISADGAGFVCPMELEIGERIGVSTGDEPLRPARVVWTAADRFGVQFEAHDGAEQRCESFTYRSARVPIDMDAKIYINGVPQSGKIVNLSPRGMALETDAKLAVGTIFSVIAMHQEFHNVTVRWNRKGLIGARLSPQVQLGHLQKLVAAHHAIKNRSR